MEPTSALEIAQNFIEGAKAAKRVDDVSEAFRIGIELLGYKHFACVSYTDFSQPTPVNIVESLGYPKEWIDRYVEEAYQHSDKILELALRQNVPFAWTDEAVRQGASTLQEQIMYEAAEIGLVQGCTIPIHARGRLPAVVSVVSDTEDVHPDSREALHLMGVYFHFYLDRLLDNSNEDDAGGVQYLTDRERECLRWAAIGKSDWEIGRIIGVSQNTVHYHIERAKRKLNATTRVHAVVQAFFENQILP